MNRIADLLTCFMNKLPDLVTGKSKEYEKELYLLYGKIQNENMVFSMKFQNLKRYIFVIITLIILLTLVLSSNVFDNKSIISIDEDGHKYIERPTYDQGNISAKLIVSGDVKGDTVKKLVTLNIKPEGSNSIEEGPVEATTTNNVDAKEVIISKISSMIYSINKSDDSKAVYLPQEIEGLSNVTWSNDENNFMLLIAFAGSAMLLCVFLKRYDQIKTLKSRCNESIEEELPNFLNKIVLLMNAGLVLSAAFEKIVDDYNSYIYSENSYFYSQLMDISIKVAETNASTVEELKRFAERSKNREFMRVTNVISDNIHKGTELVNVLQVESGFLWFQRKKRAEEKGRIAETKLTLPLALQLLVLIMITLAPAIIEM